MNKPITGARRVLSHVQLPTRLPVLSTIVAGLVLDRLHVPEFVWGAAALFAAAYWVTALNDKHRQVEIEIDPLKSPPINSGEIAHDRSGR